MSLRPVLALAREVRPRARLPLRRPAVAVTAETETAAVELPASRLAKPVAVNLPATPVATTFRDSW